ncbi:MAG: radical SAM protein [Spirochaetaceae bacterium]|nr:MAG: radical SAM protein [Spirochaetaceae bacterium]
MIPWNIPHTEGGFMVPTHYLTVDRDGNLIVPKELAGRYGLTPGASVPVIAGEQTLFVQRPISHLNRIYVEPTNRCNFDCATCLRNAWHEDAGTMSEAIFERVLDTVRALDPPPEVFFGGFGEPTFHPRIVDMIAALHREGARTLIITNGSLLSTELSEQFVKAGLDEIWVSLDGASPESFADVRLGQELPQILDNMRELSRVKLSHNSTTPVIGVAFVAMKRNARDLPDVIKMAVARGAQKISVSNLIPYTKTHSDEYLYPATMSRFPGSPVTVYLPRMEINDYTQQAMVDILRKNYQLSIAGIEVLTPSDRCQFISRGSTTVRWDGTVVPCPPLLHTHTGFLDRRPRTVHEHPVGSLNDASLMEIWNGETYADLRGRVQRFEFSPCTICNSCELPESNLEDCFGSAQPTCGGCLWAQGFIQCP